MTPRGDNPFGDQPSIGLAGTDRSDFVEINTGQAIKSLPVSSSQSGFRWLIALVLFLSLGIMFRLFKLQIVEGPRNYVLAEGNRVRTRVLPAPRGFILDRTGQVLADNILGYELRFSPEFLPKDGLERQEALDRISQLTGMKIEDLETSYQSARASNFDFARLKPLEREQAIRLEMDLVDLPALVIARLPKRRYLDFPGLGHILGYVGKVADQDFNKFPIERLDRIVGKTGLEQIYETTLRGDDGGEDVEVDAQGRIKRLIGQRSAKRGFDIEMTLDADLQRVAAQALEDSLKSNQALSGSVIAIEPGTGAIRALYSAPSFDPNIFVAGESNQIEALLNDPNEPLLNRAIGSRLAPGSSLKPFIAVAGLSEGVINPATTLDTSDGEIIIGDFRFPDWKIHGLTDVSLAIAQSNNIFFYALAGGWRNIKGLGFDRLIKWLKNFRFDQTTGIDLPAEQAGFVPDVKWFEKNYQHRPYLGDIYNLGIGQGPILVTPIALAQATCSIAGTGIVVRPRLVDKIKDQQNKQVNQIKPQVISQEIASKDVIQEVARGMRRTVTEGSARSLDDLTWPDGQKANLAGKTGTAQSNRKDKNHAWFTSFGPVEDPKLCLVVSVEYGGEGHAAAVPVARAIWQKFLTQPRS